MISEILDISVARKISTDSSACNQSGCQVGWQCDTVANRCRNLRTRTPSCANDCPRGSYCGSKSNMCIWMTTTKALATTTAAVSPICEETSDCEDGWTCDNIANRCRDPLDLKRHRTMRVSSCENDCPAGAYCVLKLNECWCRGGARDCKPCELGFHCNKCGDCVPDTALMITTSTSPGSSACNQFGCQVGWQCDTVANRCRNLHTRKPSCANDCPRGSYCGSKSNTCIWKTSTKTLATTTADPWACNPNCEPPLVCDAVANTCRDPNTGYPSCQSKPCPSGSYCGFSSNMCECDPRTKEHCPVEGCSDGYHCNTCNVCESDTTLTRTPEISTTTQEPMTCDPTCEPQFICDAVRNVCVDPRTRQPSCSEKPCPLGASCNLAISVCSCKSGMKSACPDEGCPDGYHCNACNICEADTSLTRTPEISTTIPARRQGPMSKHELPNYPTATVAPSTTNGALTINDSSPITSNAGARICATNLLLITLSLIICVKIFS